MNFLNANGSRRMRALAAVLALALLVINCAAPSPTGIYFVKGEEAVTPDGLRQILWEPFRTSFVRPGARLHAYDKIIIDPLVIEYEKKPSPARIAYNSIEPNYKLSDGGKESMRKIYQTSMEYQLLEKGSFAVAQSQGPGVLRIRGWILDLAITAPAMKDQPPDSTTVVTSTGHMTLALDVVDASTGVALIRVADRKQIQDDRDYFVSEGVSQSGALREIFSKWARNLRREIEQLSALPEIPSPGG